MANFEQYEIEQIKECKKHGLGVKQIARLLHRRNEDIGEKINEMEFTECDCCKQSVPLETLQGYTMADGTEASLCPRCALVIDWESDF